MGFVVGLRISYAARIKHETGVITLVAGRINQPHEAELVIAEGSADMCATTRATICDPEMPNKASAVLVPAILALTEQRGLTGARAVDAYLTGFETIARIGEALGYNHYRAGWHSTATMGPIGAAMASPFDVIVGTPSLTAPQSREMQVNGALVGLVFDS